MDLINQHIADYLYPLIAEVNPFFADVFGKIQNPIKGEYEVILKYFDILLEGSLPNGIEDLRVLHVHFEDDFIEDIRELISEYILIKHYKEHQRNDVLGEIVNPSFLEEKKSLTRKWRKLSVCPTGASRKNGGNRLYKNWISEQNETEKLLQFYGELNEMSKITSKTLFNCQIKTKDALEEKFRTAPFALNIEKCESGFTYCFTNSDKGLNELDSCKNLVDSIESVVNFDCERKQVMKNFSLEELSKWNDEYDTNFKRFLIVTFGKDASSLQNIRNKIELVKSRFKIPDEASYTILSAELDVLLGRSNNPQTNIEFVGHENSLFWAAFLLEISIRELYELRSVKMMNIYGLCITQEIKGYILSDLFSSSESKLISESTKQALADLSEEALNAIKEALDNTLNLIIHSAIKENIVARITTETVLVVPDSILKDSEFKIKVLRALGLGKTNKLISWSEINSSIKKPILILSYRDQGKLPYYFYPNIIEQFIVENNISAVFLNFFFGIQYNWSKYYFYRDRFKSLNHTFRVQYFDWKKLKVAIEKTRPEVKLYLNHNLEYEYSNSEIRESCRLKLKGQRPRICTNSDLFIITNAEESVFRVDKVSNLITSDVNREIFLVQNLDEIQEDINIYEAISNTEGQEEELRIIQKQFNLGNENAGRLWKIQLKKIADAKGDEVLYYELMKYLEAKRLKIVSFYHYKNSWINPQSDSIAPLSKRVFIELCEFLGIPKMYYVIIQRIRNTSKQASRQSTTQMNRLLRDLFNDGCFNEGVDAKLLIRSKLPFYKKNHPLDELGIGENYLLDNLVTLVELIRPELKLLEIEFIEKIEQ